MNEEKRRNARTQSRFGKDVPAQRREKENNKPAKHGLKSGVNMATEGFSLEYQENSKHCFKDLDVKKKPIELRFVGLHELSTTDNGSSSLLFERDFIVEQEADELMAVLGDTTKWYDKNIVIRGQEHPQPRLVAWYGPFPYTYSGATLQAEEMPQTVLDIKERVEAFLRGNGIEVELNSVLLNLYRNEKDSVAWHSDDELSMGIQPTIASVSLGCPRKFEMKPKLHTIQQNKYLDEDSIYFVNLNPGSLIIMDGSMQKDWQHRVPKEFHDREPRINLTFRTVYPINQLSKESSFCKDNIHKSEKFSEKLCFDDESFPSLSSSNKEDKASYEVVPSVHNNSNCELQAVPSEQGVDMNQSNNNNEDCCTADNSSACALVEPEESCNESETSSEVSVAKSSYSEMDSLSLRDHIEEKIENREPASENDGKDKILASKRHEFNVNAPDFVPQNGNVANLEVSYEHKYSNCLLHELADYARTIYSMEPEELHVFREILIRKTKEKALRFTGRNNMELETLFKLTDEDLTPKCVQIILKRICSIIMVESDRYHGNRYGRGSGDSYRSKNSSRSSHRY